MHFMIIDTFEIIMNNGTCSEIIDFIGDGKLIKHYILHNIYTHYCAKPNDARISQNELQCV